MWACVARRSTPEKAAGNRNAHEMERRRETALKSSEPFGNSSVGEQAARAWWPLFEAARPSLDSGNLEGPRLLASCALRATPKHVLL